MEESVGAVLDGMEQLSDEARSYLSVLNSEQLEAVVHEGSPLLILAGAGSGKTRVITTKIAYLIGERGIDPHQILAVTFTKKAANEMQQRAVSLEPRAQYSQIRTFHSFGAWFLRLYAEYAGIDPNFTVYDDDDTVSLLQKACPKLTKQQTNHFIHEISLAKDYCYTSSSQELDEIDSDPEFRIVYEAYEKRLRQTGNVDFGDLIMLPYLVLRDVEYVRQKLLARFKVIMVDEYQDSNVAQFLLLQQLSGVQEGFAACSANPDGIYVCVVGDDDQSIYKFRGAEIKNILNFKDRFPGTKIIRLEKNYRSTAEILGIADNVVRHNHGRLGKTLHAEKGNGKQPVLAFLPNQDEEADFCGDLIKLSHEKMGIPYGDWAILYRTNAQSLTFESNFLHRKIPYQIVGSLKFYEREEIKDMLAFLSLIANPRDEVAFRRIVNKPARGIGATTQEKIIDRSRLALLADESSADGAAPAEGAAPASFNLVQTSRAMLNELSKKAREGMTAFIEVFDEIEKKLAAPGDGIPGSSPENLPGEVPEKLSALIELIAEKSGLKEYHASQDEIAGSQKVANLQELANSAVPYDLSRNGLLEFLDHIELDRTIETEDGEEDSDRVTLITLHNTKGLEFSRVIMTGMELGLFPRADKNEEEMEEERRLCYVGITRAKDELYLTSCAMRRMYGRTDYMAASPFLIEIGKENVKVLGHPPANFRASTSRNGDYGARGLSHPDTESDPIKRKYSRGKRLYHDDWGYGVIVKTSESDDGEYCISVQFENGGVKRFLPKYQEKSLMITDD